jgi:hypothetical protein
MKGGEIEQLRERLALSRGELAATLNEALDKKYSATSIRQWEEEARNPSAAVSAFLDELARSRDYEALAGLIDEPQPFGPGPQLTIGVEPSEGERTADSAPGGDSGPTAQPALSSERTVLARACEELVELIATGVGMLGAATGNLALVGDGQIISADKKALGAAYGKLAETNETFRRMLVGLTEGGAWFQVAVVTGTTVSKCWQNHAEHAAYAAQVAAQQNGYAEQVVSDDVAA